MEVNEYMIKMKNIQEVLLDIFEEEEEINLSQKFDIFSQLIKDSQKEENKPEFKEILSLITKIVNNHHRTPKFYDKIEHIILLLKDDIKKLFTNSEIFDIFKSSKQILLNLFEKQIIACDEYIAKEMTSAKYLKQFYYIFFYPEIQHFLDDTYNKKAKSTINKLQLTPSTFDLYRKNGENANYISELIRNDSIEDFIIFVNQHNISLRKKIEFSIFETNSFLINKSTTLIQYASFFGSIQIFNYLMNNDVNLDQSLWIHSIHSNKSEMLSILEENHVKIKSYEELIEESIKCFHIDFADYFIRESNNIDYYPFSVEYQDYIHFPEEFKPLFLNASKFNYTILINLLLKNQELNSISAIQNFCFFP